MAAEHGLRQLMIGPALDLDADPAAVPGPQAPTGSLIIVLAVALAGAALGALVGSTRQPPPEPRFPPAAAIDARDLYVDASKPATASGAARTGAAVAVLRLRVDNPGPDRVAFTGIAFDGVDGARTTMALSLSVGGHSTTTRDLTVRPDCSPARPRVALQARLIDSRRPGAGDVRVAPARALALGGGLCALVDAQFPPGWRTPVVTLEAEINGRDLLLTVDDLLARRLDGIVVDGRLLTTVYVGDQLLSTSARLRAGEKTRLRLRGPPPCIQLGGPTPVPSTLRLLVRADGSLEQRLVIVGPEIARWLAQGCGPDR